MLVCCAHKFSCLCKNYQVFTQVSGFILAEDLRQSKSAVFSTAPSTPALAAANEEEQKDMDEEEGEEQAEVNKENSAEEESPSRLSISVSATPGRRPLEEVAIDGGVVTYCPRYEQSKVFLVFSQCFPG